MNNKRQTCKRSRQWMLAVAGVLLGSAWLSSCSQYDLDEKTPEGWGSSIYSWLDEQGNYTNTVRMINDLGYKEVLAKTGSKTLFVADDAAYERFFHNSLEGIQSLFGILLAQFGLFRHRGNQFILVHRIVLLIICARLARCFMVRLRAPGA